ncbi:MAG: alpha/beta hydrolase-fold protein [Calditrichia bacterium]
MKRITELLCSVLFLVSTLAAQTNGRVEQHSFYSPILEETKHYYVYLPPGYDASTEAYPTVYFLRLHEYEWFNPNMPGRTLTLAGVTDTLIQNSHIGNVILVCSSTGSNNGVISGAVNMLSPALTSAAGIGTGRFEDYIVYDLIPHIDSTFRTIAIRTHRGIDGFSLGGYSSTVIGLKNPDIFSSVGSYDGTVMWHNLDAPEIPGAAPDDPIWLNSNYDNLLGPLFGVPRNVNYMLLHSATNIVSEADSATLDSLRSMRFHITAGHSNITTNLARNTQLLDSLAARGIHNTFNDVVLAPFAEHNFGFADLHASRSLVKHWETFQQSTSIDSPSPLLPKAAELYSNYPNPFNPSTQIRFYVKLPAHFSLTIYDILGRQVKTLLNDQQETGSYSVEWDGEDEFGVQASGGIYFYRLQSASFDQSRKMVLVR